MDKTVENIIEDDHYHLERFRKEYAKALDYVCEKHYPPYPPKPPFNHLFAVDTLIHQLELKTSQNKPMLTPQEKIKLISDIVDRQSNTFETLLQEAMDKTSLDRDYYGEIRGVAHKMAAVATQQKEERDALFAIIEQEPTA